MPVMKVRKRDDCISVELSSEIGDDSSDSVTAANARSGAMATLAAATIFESSELKLIGTCRCCCVAVTVTMRVRAEPYRRPSAAGAACRPATPASADSVSR